MRPQGFSSENFMPQFCCHGSRGGGSTRRPPTTSSPFSSWSSSAAAFIPEMMRPRPRCGTNHQHQHASQPSQHQTHSSNMGASFMPTPDIGEAINMAQGFLGELFGQRPATPTPDTQNRGQSADKQSSSSSSQESAEGGCRKKASAASRPKTASGATQKPARQERRNESKPSSSATRKTEEQPATKKSPSSGHSQMTQPNNSQWSHSLYFSTFTPNKVSAKVRNGQVLIRASHETAPGPSACSSKVEVTRTVTLPENVDRKTLTAVMKLDGTLMLQAQFREGRSDEQEAAEKTETPASQAESKSTAEKEDEEMEGSELKPERKPATVTSQKKMEISTHQVENVASAEQKSEMPRLQNEAEGLKPLENKADHQALENKADHQALENKAHHQALENKADHQALENKADKMKALEDRSENMHALEKAEDMQALESTTETEGNNTGLHRNKEQAAAERPDDSKSPQPAEKKEGSTEKTDDDAAAEDQHHHPDDEAKVTDNDWTCTTPSPYVEEPEDDSLSVGEELSPPSSMEDFVVITEDSLRSEKTEAGDLEEATNTENVLRFEDLAPQDQAHTEEESLKEDTYREIVTSDQTDPTRPIKRSQEPTHDSTENLPPKEPLATTVGNVSAPAHAQGGIFRVSLPLQGFSPEDVHVKLLGQTLRITAKRQCWLGDVAYTDKVEKELELPGHLDVFSVRCVYEQHGGCLVISAQPQSLQHQVPVMVQ